MARRHRMTPRRRAALKKAQAASARKRRRGRFKSVARGVGTGAAFVGGTFAAYHVNRYIVHPNQAVREIGAGGKAVGRGVTSLTRKKPRKQNDLKRSVKAVKKATDWSKFGYL